MNCVEGTEAIGGHYNLTLFTVYRLLYAIYYKPSMNLAPYESYNIYFR